jgi:hypothetical protein
MSTDPALGEYIPASGTGVDKLPGFGGVYNSINMHLYAYTHNNPITLKDPDGRQPVKDQAGTVEVFINAMNTSPSKVGMQTGAAADTTLKNFSNISGFPPKPATTQYFNMKEGRYVYTKKGGWIDMVHFLFYAGEARKQEANGVKNAALDAVQTGEFQEITDQIVSPHSAFSYEDLPSDKFGAIFGSEVFDPTSDKTLGDQIQNYLNNELGATTPDSAPNWNSMPATDSKAPPQYKNNTMTPMFINE